MKTIISKDELYMTYAYLGKIKTIQSSGQWKMAENGSAVLIAGFMLGRTEARAEPWAAHAVSRTDSRRAQKQSRCTYEQRRVA
jgi:hypothetical protein